MFLAFLALATPGCVQATLAWADLEGDGQPAIPPALGAFADAGPALSVADWQARKPAIQTAFEDYIYGHLPDGEAAAVASIRVLDENVFDGAGRLEEWRISASARFGDTRTPLTDTMGENGFLIEVVLPNDAAGPTPVVIIQSFCPRWSAMPDMPITKPVDADDFSRGFVGKIATFVFGRYICQPPYEDILAKGVAVVVAHPADVIADQQKPSLATLEHLSRGGAIPDDARWGAVAGWGWMFSKIVDALETDARFSADAMVVWGHSRYGKSALVAAAFDERIDGVIAHQSGTGGASLNRRKRGESVNAITRAYPHWFAPRYATFAGEEEDLPIDQHMLLALIAPRPILLGNARRDVWSDPAGAFRAAQGANPVYELYGEEGMAASRLDEFRPGDDIAFWLRPGTHGVVEEDWPAFMTFIDAHFGGAGEAE